jgi:hypothetical protein
MPKLIAHWHRDQPWNTQGEERQAWDRDSKENHSERNQTAAWETPVGSPKAGTVLPQPENHHVASKYLNRPETTETNTLALTSKHLAPLIGLKEQDLVEI